MNNGHTRESKHRIAVLEDEEVETFVAFCEYAYTGDYKVPALPESTVSASTKVSAQAPKQQHDVQSESIESRRNSVLSWRGTYRTESFSSAALPLVPSPPPENVVEDNGETHGLQDDPIPEKNGLEEASEGNSHEVVEDRVEDAAAPSETHDPVSDEQLVAHDRPDDEVEPENATDSSVHLVSSHEIEQVTTDSGERATLEDALPEEQPIEEPEYVYTPKKSSAKMRKCKKTCQKKSHKHPLEDKCPTSLTPPSTPPSQSAEPTILEELVPVGQSEQEAALPETPDPEFEGQRAEGTLAEAQPEVSTPRAQSPSASAIDEPRSPESVRSQSTNKGFSRSSPSPAPSVKSTSVSTAHQETSSDRPMLDMSFAKQRFEPFRHTAGLDLWGDFKAIQYEDENAPPAASSTSQACTPPYLTFHAKLYVFATRYLIPALAQLCLRKLHADLVQLPLDETIGDLEPAGANKFHTSDAQSLVLDLLHYAYTKTTRLEPISPTSATQLRENELRRLVVHYAACRVKELARWHAVSESGMATPVVTGRYTPGAKQAKPMSMKALLDQTPELASDLVYRMM
ncbi:hypothetical protein N7539_008158 [Penicillium diatomitis]|uniref:BTB domain-containing protein n=1 Tax=Penicillium diatomitis TaxID=2819901 RepID=A0A9X0BND6_9EURO|nr:uncharacterized protein N7539_008158 [Penicillium diatomitis]KAJ5475092.1 hypothetical protein N7539_008158 [Penicillium diatomitis]